MLVEIEREPARRRPQSRRPARRHRERVLPQPDRGARPEERARRPLTARLRQVRPPARARPGRRRPRRGGRGQPGRRRCRPRASPARARRSRSSTGASSASPARRRRATSRRTSSRRTSAAAASTARRGTRHRRRRDRARDGARRAALPGLLRTTCRPSPRPRTTSKRTGRQIVNFSVELLQHRPRRTTRAIRSRDRGRRPRERDPVGQLGRQRRYTTLERDVRRTRTATASWTSPRRTRATRSCGRTGSSSAGSCVGRVADRDVGLRPRPLRLDDRAVHRLVDRRAERHQPPVERRAPRTRAAPRSGSPGVSAARTSSLAAARLRLDSDPGAVPPVPDRRRQHRRPGDLAVAPSRSARSAGRTTPSRATARRARRSTAARSRTCPAQDSVSSVTYGAFDGSCPSGFAGHLLRVARDRRRRRTRQAGEPELQGAAAPGVPGAAGGGRHRRGRSGRPDGRGRVAPAEPLAFPRSDRSPRPGLCRAGASAATT